MTLALPTGPRGRVLALGLLVIAAMAIWLAVAAPLLDWYAVRADRLVQRQTLAARMDAITAALPRLRREAESAAAGPALNTVLEGSSDAVAGAALQGKLEALAAEAGTALSSAELLPVEPAGAYRRVRLRLVVNSPWPAFIQLLQAIDQASPRMLVDDLQLQPAPSVLAGAAQPLAATLSVIAFRPGDAK